LQEFAAKSTTHIIPFAYLIVTIQLGLCVVNKNEQGDVFSE